MMELKDTMCFALKTRSHTAEALSKGANAAGNALPALEVQENGPVIPYDGCDSACQNDERIRHPQMNGDESFQKVTDKYGKAGNNAKLAICIRCTDIAASRLLKIDMVKYFANDIPAWDCADKIGEHNPSE